MRPGRVSPLHGSEPHHPIRRLRLESDLNGLMLLTDPSLPAALDALIDRQRLTDDLIEMVQCGSVNPFDAPPSAEACEQEFAELYPASTSNW